MSALAIDKHSGRTSPTRVYAVGGGMLLHQYQRERFVVLDPVAAIVWQLLETGLHHSEIAELIAHQFGIDPGQAGWDIARLIEKWKLLNILNDVVDESVDERLSGYALSLRERNAVLEDETVVVLPHIRVRLRFYTVGLAAMVIDRLAKHCQAGASADITVDIYRDERRVYHAVADGKELIREGETPHIVGSIYRLLLKLDNPDTDFTAFLHAASLRRNDTSILICGRSGQGKTTTAAGLLSKGWTYLGDEMAGIRVEDIGICSLPTALSIKAGGLSVLAGMFGRELSSWPSRSERIPVNYVDPAALGELDSRTGKPSAIFFPRFEKGGRRCVVRLPPLATLEGLIDAGISMDHSVFEHGTPAQLINLVEQVPAYQISFGTFDDAYTSILSVLGEV